MMVSKTNFRAGLLGAAALAALGVMPSGPAHAGAIAYDIVAVQNLQMLTAAGGTLTTGDFTSFSSNQTVDFSEQLNGAGQVGNSTAQTQICNGPDCATNGIGENDFTDDGANGALGTHPPSKLFALSDISVTGNLLTGIAAATRAEVSIPSASNSGSAASDAGATMTVDVKAASDLSVKFTVQGFVDLLTALDNATPSGHVFASSSWSLSLFDNTAGVGLVFDDTKTSFDLIPTGAPLSQHSIDTTAGNGGTASYLASFGAGGFATGAANTTFGALMTSATITLPKDHNVTVTIQHKSQASASQIPEPMSLALLGTGLFGMGIIRRRRGAKKAA